jgi:hypothetical protein
VQDDHERRVWRWFKSQASRTVTVFLGYGKDDRFAAAHAALADALPPARVHVATGGHDWPTWRNIWNQFLDRGYM